MLYIKTRLNDDTVIMTEITPDNVYARCDVCGREMHVDLYDLIADPYLYYTYTFDKAGCQNCPHREECMGKASGGKRFQVSENTPAFYEESQRQKTEEFQEKYRKRAAIEQKNAELKRFHGMARAKGWGIRSMEFQGKRHIIPRVDNVWLE